MFTSTRLLVVPPTVPLVDTIVHRSVIRTAKFVGEPAAGRYGIVRYGIHCVCGMDGEQAFDRVYSRQSGHRFCYWSIFSWRAWDDLREGEAGNCVHGHDHWRFVFGPSEYLCSSSVNIERTADHLCFPRFSQAFPKEG